VKRHCRWGFLPQVGSRTERCSVLNKERTANISWTSFQLLQELSGWNKRYLERFGHIFIICASGKSAEEMLGAIKARQGDSGRYVVPHMRSSCTQGGVSAETSPPVHFSALLQVLMPFQIWGVEGTPSPLAGITVASSNASMQSHCYPSIGSGVFLAFQTNRWGEQC
jgi:hypothetical protein